MASVNPDVVQKLKNAQKLPIRQDGDGHEVKIIVLLTAVFSTKFVF